MKKPFIILLIPFFMVIACQNEIFPEDFIIGQEEIFHYGNDYYSTNNNIKLSVTNINDSRCPEGLTCIWAGMVQVEIQFTSTEEQNLH